MSLAEKLLEVFNKLEDTNKKEVINFVEFLRDKEQKRLESMMDSIILENQEALKELGK